MSISDRIPVPPRERITIFVTRDVAFDLKKMERVTASVLAKLGCDGCHSGRILDFHIFEQFAVNPKTLEVHELAGLAQF